MADSWEADGEPRSHVFRLSMLFFGSAIAGPPAPPPFFRVHSLVVGAYSPASKGKKRKRTNFDAALAFKRTLSWTFFCAGLTVELGIGHSLFSSFCALSRTHRKIAEPRHPFIKQNPQGMFRFHLKLRGSFGRQNWSRWQRQRLVPRLHAWDPYHSSTLTGQFRTSLPNLPPTSGPEFCDSLSIANIQVGWTAAGRVVGEVECELLRKIPTGEPTSFCSGCGAAFVVS